MKTLKVIVVAYERVIPLRILADCFLVQTDPHWEMYIIHDGPYPTDVMKVIPEDSRIHFTWSPTRNGKWGHPNRRHMLETLPMDNDDFVLITNDDNYYVPQFVAQMREGSRNDTGLIYCDCLHNYRQYDILKSELKVNHIDMGSFIVCAHVAKKVGFTSDAINADGFYAEACAAYCDKYRLGITYVPRPLFVHN